MVTFAACIAAAFFVVGLIGSFFVAGANLGERFMIAVTVSATTFAAAFILCWRDDARNAKMHGAVQRMLLARGDVTDEEFNAHFPDVDTTLVAQTRQAVAEFFEVPILKVHPTDDLYSDLSIATLDPAFQFSVIHRVFGLRSVVVLQPSLVGTGHPKNHRRPGCPYSRSD